MSRGRLRSPGDPSSLCQSLSVMIKCERAYRVRYVGEADGIDVEARCGALVQCGLHVRLVLRARTGLVEPRRVDGASGGVQTEAKSRRVVCDVKDCNLVRNVLVPNPCPSLFSSVPTSGATQKKYSHKVTLACRAPRRHNMPMDIDDSRVCSRHNGEPLRRINLGLEELLELRSQRRRRVVCAWRGPGLGASCNEAVNCTGNGEESESKGREWCEHAGWEVCGRKAVGGQRLRKVGGACRKRF